MGSNVVSLRRAGRVTVLLVLVAMVAMLLVAAVPAMASTTVKKGSSQFVVSSKAVTHLQAKSVSIYAISPVTFKPQWTSHGTQWWYRAPMKAGGTYNWNTKKGVFFHKGSLRWVEASGTTHKQVRWEGLQIIANGKSSYALSAAVGNTSPLTRMTVATASNTPKLTKSGKSVTIDGVQFKLTAAGATALFDALGVHISTTEVLFDTDVLFVLK